MQKGSTHSVVTRLLTTRTVFNIANAHTHRVQLHGLYHGGEVRPTARGGYPRRPDHHLPRDPEMTQWGTQERPAYVRRLERRLGPINTWQPTINQQHQKTKKMVFEIILEAREEGGPVYFHGLPDHDASQ